MVSLGFTTNSHYVFLGFTRHVGIVSSYMCVVTDLLSNVVLSGMQTGSRYSFCS